MPEKVLIWHGLGKTLVLMVFGEEGRAEFESSGHELDTWPVYPPGIHEGLNILEFDVHPKTGEWINAKFRNLDSEEWPYVIQLGKI